MKGAKRTDIGTIMGVTSLAVLLTSTTTLVLSSPIATPFATFIILSILGLSLMGSIASAWLLWGPQTVEEIQRLRTPLKVSPEAVDIILARAIAEPYLGRMMIETLKNAIGSYSSRNTFSLIVLNWFIPGTSTTSHWELHNRKLSVQVTHPDFRIAHGRLYLRRQMIPETIITGIEHMRLIDLIEIPFLRSDNFIEAANIRFKPDAVVFDVFRDERTLDEVFEALRALHDKSFEGKVINHPTTPLLGS